MNTGFRIVGVLLSLFAAQAMAQSTVHDVYLDLDADPATGCSVVTDAGPVSGVEMRLRATVDGDPAQVQSVTRATCVGAAFGAPQSQPAGYAVGLNLGTGGADVVEFSTALAGLGDGGDVPAVFVSSTADGADMVQAIVTLPGVVEPPIQAEPTVIPATGWLALLLLIGFTVWLVRRHPGFGSTLAVIVMMGAGVAWAANFVADGQVLDWTGETPVATDPANDASDGSAEIDIVAVFAATENARLHVRFDVRDLEPTANQAPTLDPIAFTLAENSAAGSAVGSIAGTDPDAGQALTYAITGGNTGNAFAIDADSGAIAVATAAAIDFETTTSFALTVTATDDGTPALSATATVTIDLDDVNEAPQIDAQTFAVAENAANGSNVGAVVASDPDGNAPNATLTYAITGGNTGNAFAIDADSGVISVATSAAITLANAPFTLVVAVTDGGTPGLSDSAPVTIDVTDQNDAPEFATPNYAFAIDENGAAGSAVGVVAATDPDAGQTLAYSIASGNTDGAFALDATSGAITVANAAAIDFETNPSFTLIVNVTDDSTTPLTDSASVSITLNDINEAPVTDNRFMGVAENSPIGTPIGTPLPSFDPDTTAPNFTVAFAIISGNTGGAFAIDATSGQIAVANDTAVTLANSPFVLGVTLTDGGTPPLSDSAVVTITVTDQNDAPVLGDAAVSIDENAANGSAVATVTGTDVDAGQTLAYSITAGNTGATFAIDAISGAVTVADNTLLDFETTPAFVLTITATDDGTPPLSDTGTLTVSLNDVNDAPVANDASVTLPENSAIGTAVTTVVASDTDAADTLAYAITAGNAAGAFAIDAGTGAISVANAAPLDLETTPQFSLTVSVTDDGTPQLVDTAAIVIDLGDVNEAPTVADALFSVPEASPVGTLVGTVVASDPDQTSPNGDLTFAIDAGNTGGAFAIDADGDITVATPAAIQFGDPDFVLTVSVTDAGAGTLSDTATVTIAIDDVNEAPTSVALVPSAVAENQAAGTAIGALSTVDPDVGNSHTYTLACAAPGANDGLVAIAANTLNTNAILDFETTPTLAICVRSTDAGGLFVDQPLSVTVTDVDDMPVAVNDSATVAEDSGANAINVLGNDTDQDGGPISIVSTTAATGGSVAITGGGTGLTYTPNANVCSTTPDTFTYTLAPGGSTATVSVTVTCNNDAPVLTVPGAQTIGAGGTRIFSALDGNAITVADVDAASGVLELTLSVGTGNGALALTDTGALAGIVGQGTDTIVATGTLAALNAALDEATYTAPIVPPPGGSATLQVGIDDQGNTGSGGALSDSDSVVISIDNAPALIASTPVAGTTVANNVTLSLTFSEAIDAALGSVTLTCGGGDLITGGTVGSNVTSLTPTYSGALPAGACTLTVLAASITDVDSIDPPDSPPANIVIGFTVDAAPTVVSTVPANGAINAGIGSTLTVNFSETVDIAANGITLDCGAPVAFNAGPLPAVGVTSVTLVPSAALPEGATCNAVVIATSVTDTDTFDPPSAMPASFNFSFTTDAAPTVGTITPADAASIATNQPIVVTFSENVDLNAGSFTLQCPNGTPIALNSAPALPATGTFSITLTPAAALPEGEDCVFTVVAAQVIDSDSNDPPNTMAANVVRNYSVDEAPAVSAIAPVNGSTGVNPLGNFTISFSESVNFSTLASAANTSFDLDCGGVPADFVVLSASPATSVILDPLDTAIVGQNCTLSVRAAGITDADSIDPPDALAADVTSSFSVGSIATADAYNVTPHLTLAIGTASPQAGGVLGNDILGPGGITGFGLSPACATQPAGSMLDAGAANGRLTLASDGSFSYEPPAGITSTTRTFCYTVTGGGTAAIVFTLQATELTWFIDSAAAAGGIGTQARPFQSIPVVNALATANDTIFVRSSGAAYIGGLVLPNGARLVGSGSTADLQTVSGIVPVAGSAFPALSGVTTTIAGDASPLIRLASGSVVRGVTLATLDGYALLGNAIAGSSVSESVIASIGSGGGIQLLNATGTVTFAGVPVSGTLDATRAALAVSGGNATVSFTASPFTALQTGQALNIDGIGGSIAFDATSDIASLGGRGLVIANLLSTASVTLAGVDIVADAAAAATLSGNAPASTVAFDEGALLRTTATNANAFNAGTGRLRIAGTNSLAQASDGAALAWNGVTLIQDASFVTLVSTSSNAAGVSIAAPVGNFDVVVSGDTTISTPTAAAIDVTSPAASGFALRLTRLVSSGGSVGINVQNAAVSVSNNTSTLTTTAGPAIVCAGSTTDLGFATLTAAGGASGVKFTTCGGTVTAGSGTLNSTAGPTNHVVDIATSTVNLLYGGTIAKTTAGRAVNIDGLAAPGAVTFVTTVTASNASNGVSIANSTRPVTFSTLALGAAANRFGTAPLSLAGNTGAVDLGIYTSYTNAVPALEINYANASPGLVTTDAGSLLDANGATAALTVGHATNQPLSLNVASIANAGAGTYGVSINRGSGAFVVTGLTNLGAKTIAGVQIANSSLVASLKELDINGAADGVRLTNNTGSFTILGDGNFVNSHTDGAGGTFINLIDNAFDLNGVTDLRVTDVTVNGTGGHGVTGSGLSGTTIFSNVDMSSIGNADNEHVFNFQEGAVAGAQVSGSLEINNSTIENFTDNGLYLENFSGALNLRITDTVFRNNITTTACGGDNCNGNGLLLRADGTSSITGLIHNNTFERIDGIGVSANPEGNSNARMDLTIINNAFNANVYGGAGNTNNGEIGLSLRNAQGNSRLYFAAANNTFRNYSGELALGVVEVEAGDFASVDGLFDNNSIEAAHLGNGFALFADGAHTSGAGTTNFTMNVELRNNVIAAGTPLFGVALLSNNNGAIPGSTVSTNLIASNNSFQAVPTGTARRPITLNLRDQNNACTNITGNTVSGGTGGTQPSVNLSYNGVGAMRLQGMSGTGDANAVARLGATNTLTVAAASGPNNTITSATCATPVAPTAVP